MKSFQSKSFFAALFAASLISMPLFADDNSNRSSETIRTTEKTSANHSEQKASSPMMDQLQRSEILSQIHHTNQKEIELSKMALKKTQSQQVKEFAQHMIADHQNADRKVSDLAKSNKVDLHKFQPSENEKASMDQLSKLKGSQFDQAFLASMEMGHKSVAQQLELARSDARDPQVKTLIDELLPTVRNHLKMSAQLENKTNPMSG